MPYALCFADETGRCLTSIGYSSIHFNLGNAYIVFDTPEDAHAFVAQHGGHFFKGLTKLVVVEKPK